MDEYNVIIDHHSHTKISLSLYVLASAVGGGGVHYQGMDVPKLQRTEGYVMNDTHAHMIINIYQVLKK